jgi:hypothetical protein
LPVFAKASATRHSASTLPQVRSAGVCVATSSTVAHWPALEALTRRRAASAASSLSMSSCGGCQPLSAAVRAAMALRASLRFPSANSFQIRSSSASPAGAAAAFRLAGGVQSG